MKPPRPAQPLRRLAFWAALALVLALHAWLGRELAQRLPSFDVAGAAPPRLQAAFVRELALAQPPPVAVAAAVPPPAVPPPAAALSGASAPAEAPDAAASAPEPASEPAPEAASAPAVDPPPQAASQPAQVAASASPAASAPLASPSDAADAVPAATAASGAGFRWPASTRLRYVLTGNLRGEVHGSAQVEWIRSGPRYQVHLDITVGLPFAPLMSRRMTSDGSVTPQGLAPERYDEETKIGFGDLRRNSLLFDAQTVRLSDGHPLPAPPGVQDAASQFVQMVFLFRTGAIAPQPGAQVEMPLALPKRVDRWIYDVVGEELLYAPFGHIGAWHLVPRPLAGSGAIAMEAWFAPSLQYLPVRILIRRGRDDVIDLMIERLPQQADDDEVDAPRGGSAAP